MPIPLTSLSVYPHIPFTVNHLLLAGTVVDRGQLTPAIRAELEQRVSEGDLVKATTEEGLPCWRVANLPVHLPSVS